MVLALPGEVSSGSRFFVTAGDAALASPAHSYNTFEKTRNICDVAARP